MSSSWEALCKGPSNAWAKSFVAPCEKGGYIEVQRQVVCFHAVNMADLRIKPDNANAQDREALVEKFHVATIIDLRSKSVTTQCPFYIVTSPKAS